MLTIWTGESNTELMHRCPGEFLRRSIPLGSVAFRQLHRATHVSERITKGSDLPPGSTVWLPTAEATKATQNLLIPDKFTPAVATQVAGGSASGYITTRPRLSRSGRKSETLMAYAAIRSGLDPANAPAGGMKSLHFPQFAGGKCATTKGNLSFPIRE